MYIFHLFRSFIPSLNPIGFSASDFIELILTVLFVLLALASRPWIEPYGSRFAQKTGWCMAVLALLPHRASARAVAAISDSGAGCFR